MRSVRQGKAPRDRRTWWERSSVAKPPAEPSKAALSFHRLLPGYVPTRLVEAPPIASAAEVERVWVKDESMRLSLPSFKILGASWATHQALCAWLGHDRSEVTPVSGLLAELGDRRQALTLAAATDGNHGRAVAHIASLWGLQARIYVPQGTAPARVAAIKAEGATCIVGSGTYDDAVQQSLEDADESTVVINDTALDGHDDVPRWVIEGYATILWEVEEQLTTTVARQPDVVVIQMGCGALAAAVIRQVARWSDRPLIVGVEPADSACVLASLQAGRPTSIAGPLNSIMVGLNCGTPSASAWPDLAAGLDVALPISDERARQGMVLLASVGIVSGETGAAGVGGLLELAALRPGLVGQQTNVLVFATEGPTDPVAYQAIVGSTSH